MKYFVACVNKPYGDLAVVISKYPARAQYKIRAGGALRNPIDTQIPRYKACEVYPAVGVWESGAEWRS